MPVGPWEQEQLKQLRAKLRESNHVVGETALNAYLDSITSHEEHIREHQQEAAFHRDIILTHQDKVQYHEQQIVKHQDAISTLHAKIHSLAASPPSVHHQVE
ncbi:hypothetical protein OTU49_007495 [Cherax quadricarinatus]|uniref:Uncharacterized protein n=1 Tax=Cherax quadricarinatus TaxID=27406 RepID=A0AAW0WVE5_CHEQU